MNCIKIRDFSQVLRVSTSAGLKEIRATAFEFTVPKQPTHVEQIQIDEF
jgi:hypothetical protein